MQIPMIPVDKANHAVYGGVIFAVSYTVLAVNAVALAVHLAMVSVVVIALVKEYVYDKRHPDTATTDPKDALATVLGATPMWGALMVAAR